MSVKENVKSNRILKVLTLDDITELFWIVTFTIATAIAAQVTIPVKPVPFTFQTTMVVLSGAFLGARNGAYSQIIYLFLGCLGLPVFAQIPDSSIGIARLFGPTGGYLLAFPAGAFITGYLVKKFMSILPSGKNYIGILISMLAGEVLIICTGAAYLGAVYLKNMHEAFISGAAVFLIWTIAKAIIGASIYFGISNTKLQKKN